MKKLAFIAFITACLITPSAFAKEKDEEVLLKGTEKEAGYNLDLKACDFLVTFPEKPYIAQKCKENSSTTCYKMYNFTKVFKTKTTVNFRVTCNPAPEGAMERYSGATMKTVLKGMIDNQTITKHETNFTESEYAKIATLTGEGQTGLSPMIYTSQIWIGPESLLTVEGELIGEEYGDAGELFVEILSSIKSKAEEAEKTKESEENKEKE